MAHLIRMPGISADAEEVVFLEWNVETGSSIKIGDLIATVETEKANVDIESDYEGVLWRQLVEPGESVEVGSPVAVMLAVNEAAEDGDSILTALGLSGSRATGDQSEISHDPQPSSLATIPSPLADNPKSDSSRIFASPLARRTARERGIPLASVVGTGPGERIIRADIDRAIAKTVDTAHPFAPVPNESRDSVAGFTDIPHSGMRRAVARSLTMSKQQIPHFYVEATCDVDALVRMRTEINATQSFKYTLNDLVLKAVAKTLVEVPEMNVIWMNDCVRRFDSVDISVAIGSDAGLVTPVIRRADQLSLTQIASIVQDFTVRAKDGRLKQHELEGGSFCVSNLGMFGVDRFSAIVNPPQSGILAVGAIAQRPVTRDGTLNVGHTLMVTLSADHRPVDGVVAARWLARFRTFVENPASILI
jgi:pyruvate dehydrogenase E2 component (dihydrolipoamide acetyltransferase)